MSVFKMFAELVAAEPGKEMFADEQRSLSRADFMEESRQVAAWLVAQGIGREDVVAIMLPRGVAVATCMAGI